MALRALTAPLADSAGLGTAALQAVVAAISDPDYAVRINAARTLGTYPEPSSVQALTGALAGTDGHLAITAAESLGRLRSAASLSSQRLGEIALDATRSVAFRQTALEALAMVDPARGAEVAERLAFDPAWRVRAAAARALASAPPAAQDRMATLRRDPDGRVASAALQALVGAAGDSLAPLRSVLIESLGMQDIGVRTAALSALGRLADPATLPMLLDAYGRSLADDDNDAQLAAIDAIAALERPGTSPARAFFTRFLRSDDYLVRLRAQARFGGAADAWGDPLPLEPRHVAYAELLAAAQPPNSLPRAVIETNAGIIELRLFARDATLTVENFTRLARSGYFDGQEWPRVVPNFVVQGGDPRGDTSGGPGYSIRDEFNRHRYGTGTLGMALSGPDTGGSQWFITHSPQPHLDGAYTVFGEVVTGQDVVERIVPGDRILRIHVLP
jgi:cyclophilin family peptidyl-prolyl cis-trans isomerase/HEAT repeat protein